MAQKTEERECFAELHRLKGVFLTALGADESKIEASLSRRNQNRKGAEVDFA